MKNVLLLLSVFSIAFFQSCKKSKNDDDDGGGGQTGKRLVKITEVTGGQTRIYNFHYDNNNRLLSYKSTDNVDQITFTYDANGNVTKLEEHNEDFHNVYTYTYSNNIPQSATFKSWQKGSGGTETLHEDDVLTYTVTNGQVTGILLEDLMGMNSFAFGLNYNSEGNLVKVQSAGGGFYTANFTYDNKKSMFPKVFQYVMDQAGLSMQFYAKNTLTSMNFDFPGTTNDHTITLQHTYDSDGYVVTTNDGTTVSTYEYQ